MQDYQGKVAVITGAGRGIGRGIALRCAKEGMKVVLAGIGMESLEKTEKDLIELGAETLIVQTDVSLLEDVENLADKSYEKFEAVDLMVNNAGVFSRGKITELSMDDWHWVMGVNFYGVVHGVRTFVPRMSKQNTEGRIVNISSISGIYPGGGSYGISKQAVIGLSEALYLELLDRAPKLKVTVFCPGWVDTEFDTIERSRPGRFNQSAIEITDEQRKSWRKSLSEGLTIHDTADILFEGMKKNNLYVGPKAFAYQDESLPIIVRERMNNILEERNPVF